MIEWYKRRRRLTSAQIIIFGFLAVILAGSVLLRLPIASRVPDSTTYLNALFTAVSSTCVTGLAVYDTATHWSMFGQVVLLLLIQIGGLGVILTAVLIQMFIGSRISLIQRTLLQDSISGDNVTGILKMSFFILKTVLFIELFGAVLLYPSLSRDFGPKLGIWYALFHSISAFCNAGFDLMGVRYQFSSLTFYQSDISVNLIIMFLIVAGALGFYTWRDLQKYHLRFSRWSLQSRVVLMMSALLIFIPAIIFFFSEFRTLPIRERILSSLFQSVTTRTAGFNTADLNQLSDNGILIMIVLMLTGGAPGSTAGGMKLTTIAVLIATFVSLARQDNETVLLDRRIPQKTVRRAMTLLVLYLSGFLLASMVISCIEHASLRACFFEAGSAIATVGLSLGLTPHTHIASRIILMLLMFMGRIGGLTFMYATIPKTHVRSSVYPPEDLNVG